MAAGSGRRSTIAGIGVGGRRTDGAHRRNDTGVMLAFALLYMVSGFSRTVYVVSGFSRTCCRPNPHGLAKGLPAGGPRAPESGKRAVARALSLPHRLPATRGVRRRAAQNASGDSRPLKRAEGVDAMNRVVSFPPSLKLRRTAEALAEAVRLRGAAVSAHAAATRQPLRETEAWRRDSITAWPIAFVIFVAFVASPRRDLRGRTVFVLYQCMSGFEPTHGLAKGLPAGGPRAIPPQRAQSARRGPRGRRETSRRSCAVAAASTTGDSRRRTARGSKCQW